VTAMPDVLLPDYRKNFLEWCTDLTRYLIESSQRLVIWSLLHNDASLTRPSLLSWAVDFGANSPNLLFSDLLDRDSFGCLTLMPEPRDSSNGQYRQSIHARLEAHSDPRVFALQGFQFDTIQSVGPLLGPQLGLVPTWRAFSEELSGTYSDFDKWAKLFIWAILMPKVSPYSWKDHHLAGFYFLMLQYLRQLNIYDPLLVREFKEGIAGYWAMFSVSQLPLQLSPYEMSTKTMHDFAKNTPLATGHGLFWAKEKNIVRQRPTRVQPGDIVCCLYGGANPLILRPAGDGKFFLVGPCYLAVSYCGRSHADVDKTFCLI